MNEVEGQAWMFAVLGQTGIEHCPEGSWDPTWLDVHPTLGFVPSDGATLEADELLDQPVLARGTALGEAPPRPPLRVTPIPCPMMQMRSDWVNTPRGIRVQRSASPNIAHFRATSVRRLDELTVTREGDELVVRLTNPLPFALAEVRLQMHYEGCHGKPGTASLASEAITLEPGATATHRFALIVERDHPGPRKGGPTARQHRAAALVLSLPESAAAGDTPVYADLAVSLNHLGIAFDRR